MKKKKAAYLRHIWKYKVGKGLCCLRRGCGYGKPSHHFNRERIRARCQLRVDLPGWRKRNRMYRAAEKAKAAGFKALKSAVAGGAITMGRK